MHIEQTADPNRATVAFENAHERYFFGRNAPLWSAERYKAMAWDAQGFWLMSAPDRVAFWRQEFPQTVEVSSNLIECVADRLSEKKHAKKRLMESGEANLLDGALQYIRRRKLGTLPEVTS